MRWDIRVTIYALFASAALAVALTAAAVKSYFEGVFGAICLWGGVFLFVVLSMAALREALLGERRFSKLGHRKRVISLYGMIVSGLVFLVFVLIYLVSLYRGSVSADFVPASLPSASLTKPEYVSPNWNIANLQHAYIDAAAASPETTNRSPKELLDFYKNRTGLQAYALFSPYVGLRIKAEGKVELLMPDGQGFVAALAQPDGAQIECRFNQAFATNLARYNQGDTMAVIGVILPSQNGSQLYLGACALL